MRELEVFKEFLQEENKPSTEKMYSEAEVLQLLLKLQQTESYDNLYDWFEQFKKKQYTPKLYFIQRLIRSFQNCINIIWILEKGLLHLRL